MIKKPLSLLLLVCFALTLLAGCSPEDIGYLDMMVDAQSVKTGTMDATITVTLDDLEQLYLYDLPFSTISLNMSGNVDSSNPAKPYMDLQLHYSLDNGGKQPLGRLLMADNGLYCNSELFAGIIQLAGLQEDMEDAELQVWQEFLGQLNRESRWFLLVDYNAISNSNDFDYGYDWDEDAWYGEGEDYHYYYDDNYYYSGGLFDTDLAEMYGAIQMYSDENLIEAVKKFYLTAFTGLDSQCITATSNGYRLSLDAWGLKDLMIRSLNYLAENSDQFLDAVIILIEDMAPFWSQMGLYAWEIEDLTADLANPDFRQEIKGDLAEMTQEFQSSGWAEEMAVSLDGSSLTVEVSREGGGFRSRQDIKAAFDGQQLFSLAMDSTMRSTTNFSRLNAPANIITLPEAERRLNKMLYDSNPVWAAVISWEEYYSGDYNYADIDIYKGSRDDLETDYDWDYFELKNGVLYMPVYILCDIFGEDYTWDNDEQQLYLVRDANVPVQSHHSENYYGPMMPVRELAKLGYTVKFYRETDDYYPHVMIFRDQQAPMEIHDLYALY